MLGAVKAAHPKATITVLVSENAYPFFVDDNRFDIVVSSDLYGRRPRKLPRLRKLAAAARLAARLGFGYDLVITFLGGTGVLNLIAWAVGRKRRIGYPHRYLRILTSGPSAYGDKGDFAANLALLEAAGISRPDGESPALLLNSAQRLAAKRLLAARGRIAQRPLIVFHSGSDWACQQWLPDRWAQLADRIIARYGSDIVFTGAAAENSYIEQIRRHMALPSISIAGETTLLGLAAVIAEAALCVAVDSAAHDLAQALGIPAVAIAGPTMPEAPEGRSLHVVNRMLPEIRKTVLDCQGRFPLGLCHDYSCPLAGLKNVSVDRVLEEVSRLVFLPADTESMAGSAGHARSA
jgi:ADP-heptose:LPS heptosyltransferase